MKLPVWDADGIALGDINENGNMLLYDVTGDGQAELFIPDSGIIREEERTINLLHILRLGRKTNP